MAADEDSGEGFLQLANSEPVVACRHSARPLVAALMPDSTTESHRWSQLILLAAVELLALSQWISATAVTPALQTSGWRLGQRPGCVADRRALRSHRPASAREDSLRLELFCPRTAPGSAPQSRSCANRVLPVRH